MKTYLVGGSVRDQLLGKPITDRDWVVVGAQPEQLLEQGYLPVGKDFPVFLHPKTKEQYALARTERKTGHGYTGFDCYSSPDVTLEQDLARRDLTINAMALDQHDRIIDPFNGQTDLNNRCLRHISSAFVEDPVRVLRVARFAARFGFTVAEETLALMRTMSASGELQHLVPERIWQELYRALETDTPSLFFTTLRQVGALEVLFPEIDRLFGVPQVPKWHPEVDTGVHVMMVLDQAAKLTKDPSIIFAALCHDLGKGNTPESILPQHNGHEARSVSLTKELCERLKVPKKMQSLATKVARYHTHMHLLMELKASTILEVIEALDSYRNPEQFEQYLLASEADFRGRPGYEQAEMPNVNYFKQCYQASKDIDISDIVNRTSDGKAIADRIRQRRIAAIDNELRAIKLPLA